MTVEEAWTSDGGGSLDQWWGKPGPVVRGKPGPVVEEAWTSDGGGSLDQEQGDSRVTAGDVR